MSDSVDRVFVHALNTVKKIPRTGSARPPSADRLKLYGLYKQSMEGDVAGVMARPAGEDDKGTGEVEKWDAWAAQHGLSRTAAKRHYISTLIATMHTYASATPDARALVAELEFVWDQIRANDASPSASEELEPPPFPPLPAVGTESLRLLRPFSESDDADDEPEEDGLDALGEQALMADKTRRRQWQARMERAVVQLAAEVAALREVVGAQQGRGGKRGWGWVGWMVGVLVRHALFDALVLGCAVVWGQWRGEDWRWETIRGWVRKWWEGWRRRTKWRVRANG